MPCGFSFFPEQVVDGGAECGRQIVQLVVSDDSAAVFNQAEDLLRDVQPADLELIGELLLCLFDSLAGDVAPAVWFVYFRSPRLPLC